MNQLNPLGQMMKPSQKNNRRRKGFNDTSSPLSFAKVNGEQISKKEETILKESLAEFRRRGNFSLLFPCAASNMYKSYFEEPRPLN